MPLEIIPSVDLRAGRVVRLKQGDYGQQINYDVDPVETAMAYQAAGARWLHIVDLDGAKEGKPMQTALIARMISASAMQVQVGGGVRTENDITRLLAAGARRVVVGTRAMEDWAWFGGLVKRDEFQGKVVLALDARDGIVAVRGWTEASGRHASDVAREVSDWPLAAILYTDVARDGMMEGPNYSATTRLCEAGAVPVIASGGVGDIEHLRRLTQTPAWGVVVGRSLYEGKVDLREAMAMTVRGQGQH